MSACAALVAETIKAAHDFLKENPLARVERALLVGIAAKREIPASDIALFLGWNKNRVSRALQIIESADADLLETLPTFSRASSIRKLVDHYQPTKEVKQQIVKAVVDAHGADDAIGVRELPWMFMATAPKKKREKKDLGEYIYCATRGSVDDAGGFCLVVTDLLFTSGSGFTGAFETSFRTRVSS